MLFGDAYSLNDAARGGNDLPLGGRGDDTLFGDGFALDAGTRAGDDLVDGGQGDDVLFGGAAERDPQAHDGNDVFRFAPGSGHDVIADFDDGAGGGPQDLIDLSCWTSFSSFADLAGHLDGKELSLGARCGTAAGTDTLLVTFAADAGTLDATDFIFA
ncbi:MAG: hypothetical protein ACJ8H8_23680 [Geminicoccaceae bacterium]